MNELHEYPDRVWASLNAFWQRRRWGILIALFLFCFIVLMLWPRIFYTVQPGFRGVLFRRLGGGTVLTHSFPEGLNIVNPLNEFIIYDMRIHEMHETVPVLSNNGLTIRVGVTYRYKPVVGELPYLHQKIGPDYERKIIVPTVVSSVREVVGKYKPQELFTTHRITIQDEAMRECQIEVKGKHVEFDSIIIHRIQLPELINNAIEAKLRQEQQFQEYEFRIEKETKEAERKRIEAAGIRDFQALGQLTPAYLTWQGIRATLELARSQNAKVVVIGGGGGEGGSGGLGLPIILGTDWTKEGDWTKDMNLPQPGAAGGGAYPSDSSNTDILNQPALSNDSGAINEPSILNRAGQDESSMPRLVPEKTENPGDYADPVDSMENVVTEKKSKSEAPRTPPQRR